MATISAARIGNLALSAIGTRSTIESLDEASAEAKQVKLWYDFSREQALKAYNWSFARKRIALGVHNVAAPDEYGYRYIYPADCIVLRKLVNPYGRQNDAVHYTIESVADGSTVTKSILTDLDSAVAMYTFDVTDATLFSPYFVELFAHLIAHHVAFPLTGDRTIKSDMLKLYQGMLAGAPMHDANEEVAEPQRDAEWIRARGVPGLFDEQV